MNDESKEKKAIPSGSNFRTGIDLDDKSVAAVVGVKFAPPPRSPTNQFV